MMMVVVLGDSGVVTETLGVKRCGQHGVVVSVTNIKGLFLFQISDSETPFENVGVGKYRAVLPAA